MGDVPGKKLYFVLSTLKSVNKCHDEGRGGTIPDIQRGRTTQSGWTNSPTWLLDIIKTNTYSSTRSWNSIQLMTSQSGLCPKYWKAHKVNHSLRHDFITLHFTTPRKIQKNLQWRGENLIKKFNCTTNRSMKIRSGI
jgi:hypothetical protein